MSENKVSLVAAEITTGYDTVHAIQEPGESSIKEHRGMVYSRPLCGLRGRDATGFTTVRPVRREDAFVPFRSGSEDFFPDSLRGYKVCPRCVRIAEKVESGMTVREATVVHAPKINARVRAEIEKSADTDVTIQVLKDISVTDNVSGQTARDIIVDVLSAPIREIGEWVLDYPENVIMPSVLSRVWVKIKGGDASVVGKSMNRHPKTFAPITGKKLPRFSTVEEDHPDVEAVIRLLGI